VRPRAQRLKGPLDVCVSLLHPIYCGRSALTCDLLFNHCRGYTPRVIEPIEHISGWIPPLSCFAVCTVMPTRVADRCSLEQPYQYVCHKQRNRLMFHHGDTAIRVWALLGLVAVTLSVLHNQRRTPRNSSSDGLVGAASRSATECLLA